MSYEPPSRDERDAGRYDRRSERGDAEGDRDDVYSKRVPAGKRTYFFDVKATRSGDDFFLIVTESKRDREGHYEKHKIFLYKEDFGKFVSALHEVIAHVRDTYLPDYDFRSLPELTAGSAPEGDGESSFER